MSSKAYFSNVCSIGYNKSTQYDFQGFRKGMYIQLMVMFLVYFAGQIYQAIKAGQASDADGKDEAPKVQLPWNQKRWNKVFPILFANHAVGLGFVLLFNPMPAGLILAYLHLMLFGGYIAGQLLLKPIISNVMLGLMALTNTLLMLFGLIGVNYSNFQNSSSTSCKYTNVS